ncbi:hypothetical protein B0T20DRAFT_398784 [Sordaria brevicollis]|uniref:Uncharacterized protein n=1 Tax=Sordaria brevicollis TaxID=83679 RepID=A0AAE0UFZ5_SORBR|nr:hypothetical protein B0T20DRAFT_398784 [Sordaria brevicollis]
MCKWYGGYHSSCRCLVGHIEVCSTRLKSAPFTSPAYSKDGKYTLPEYDAQSCNDLTVATEVHKKSPGCILGECATDLPPECPRIKAGLANAANSVAESDERAVLEVSKEGFTKVLVHVTFYDSDGVLAKGEECDGVHARGEQKARDKYREELEQYLKDHED